MKLSLRCKGHTQQQKMKFYAVIGGWDYEGENFDSLRLFDDLIHAQQYKEQLVEEYDYVILDIKVIEDVKV